MIDKENKETYGEENITCPSCGEVCNGDSWEVSVNYGEETCYECGTKFSWNRDIDVSYSSELLIKENK